MSTSVDDGLEFDESEPPDLRAVGWLASPAMLLGAGISVFVGGAALAESSQLFHWIGYVLSSVVAFTIVGLYRRTIVGVTARTGFVPPRWVDLVSALIVLAGFAIGFVHALSIARHYG